MTFPSQGQSQAARTALGGSWVYSGAPAQGEQIVAQAVEPVLAVTRPDIVQIARERIAESTWLPTSIRIRAGRRLEVALSGSERRVFAGAAGSTIQVPMRHGYAQLVQTIRPDGGLQQSFTALDGTQQNVFSAGPGGTMILDVSLQSPQLPSQIHFALEYRRGR